MSFLINLPFTRFELVSISGLGFSLAIALLGIRVGILTSGTRPPDMYRSLFIDFCGKAQASGLFFLLAFLFPLFAIIIQDLFAISERYLQFLSYLSLLTGILTFSFFYIFIISLDKLDILLRTTRATYRKK
jgi:hypothetical protein